MQEHQQGNVERKPAKTYRPGKGGTPAFTPDYPAEENETSFDSEDNRGEINPGKLDYEEADLSGSGADGSKGHQPYEFKNPEGPDRSVRAGHHESNFSAPSSSEEHGPKSDLSRRSDSLKKEKGILIGQGGYGTSGTSGTNSGGNQGYQSGLGSAGSQNGSTGYNAGSLGSNEPSTIHPERPNKEVDIHQLGKGIKNGKDKETRPFSGS